MSSARHGARQDRPTYPRGPEYAGTVDAEERLRRKLARARWERDRYRRRYHMMTQRYQALERRRAWVEAYWGYRAEYRLRGLWRRLRRYVHVLRRRCGL